MQKTVDKANGSDVLLKSWVTTHISGRYYWKQFTKTTIVKHIRAKSFGIQFILKGIYIHNGKYYFHTNSQTIPMFLSD
jgi:hypothetical protein